MQTYRIGVSVELFDRLGPGLAGVIRHLDQASKAATTLHGKLHAIQSNMIIGGGMMAAGGAIAGFMASATKQAMNFETALTAIKITGGFATSQMKGLRDEIEKVSGVTAFSMTDIAGFARTIEQSTSMSADKLRTMLPMLSQFAGVMQFVKGASPGESVMIGTQFSELFGGFSADKMQSNLDAFYKVSKATVATPSELLASLRNFVPIGRTLGVTSDQSIMLAGVLSNLGMTATGGASLNTLLTKVIPTSRMTQHHESAAFKAMSKIGLVDKRGQSTLFDQSGHMDVMKLLAILGEAGKRLSPKDLSIAFHDIAGIRGQRAAAILSDPKVQERLHQALLRLDTSSGVVADHAELMKTAAMQFQRAMTNLQNVMIELGAAWVPKVTTGLKFMAERLSTVADLITPGRADTFMKVLAALSASLFAAGLMKSIAAVTQLISLFGAGTAANTLAGVLSGMPGLIVGITVAYAALSEVADAFDRAHGKAANRNGEAAAFMSVIHSGRSFDVMSRAKQMGILRKDHGMPGLASERDIRDIIGRETGFGPFSKELGEATQEIYRAYGLLEQNGQLNSLLDIDSDRSSYDPSKVAQNSSNMNQKMSINIDKIEINNPKGTAEETKEHANRILAHIGKHMSHAVHSTGSGGGILGSPFALLVP